MTALLTALAALTALVTTLAAPLPPGRYAGQIADGRVDLALFADGRAIFGGAAMRWSPADDALTLRAPGGRALTLTLRYDDRGALLEGGPHGAIRLQPLPDIEPVREVAPVRPLDWIGGWPHRATGGALVLRLRGDGRYEMQQPAGPGETTIGPTGGAWQARDGRLLLTPDGGAPLSYTARRDGADLLIGGGDLPVEVRFTPDTPQ